MFLMQKMGLQQQQPEQQQLSKVTEIMTMPNFSSTSQQPLN